MFSEIYKMQHDLNKLIGRDTINSENKKEWFFDYCFALSKETQELMDCCNWKFWAQEGKIDQYKKILDEKEAKIEAIDCLHFLISIFQILDMTPEEISYIYKKKHEINISRQQNNYSIATKTEDDNNQLKQEI